MTPLVVAAAILTGRPVPLASAAILAVATLVPAWAPLPLLIWWARRRRSAGDGEVAWLSAAAAGAAAGLPLREALLRAGGRGDLEVGRFNRRLAAGLPLHLCAPEVAAMLPSQGPALAHALAVTSRSGGAMGPLLDRLTERAATHLDLRREVREATATARASLLALGGIPLLVAGHRLGSASGTAEQALVAAGITLIAAGASIGWFLVRRARP